MTQRNPSADTLYEMAMQRIGDLRCDAARGRDLKRHAGDVRDRDVEPVITTASTLCSQHVATTLSHQR